MPMPEIAVASAMKSRMLCVRWTVWYGSSALTTAMIWSSFSRKKVTRKIENAASSGTAVSSVVKESDPARSKPRSARKPRIRVGDHLEEGPAGPIAP